MSSSTDSSADPRANLNTVPLGSGTMLNSSQSLEGRSAGISNSAEIPQNGGPPANSCSGDAEAGPSRSLLQRLSSLPAVYRQIKVGASVIAESSREVLQVPPNLPPLDEVTPPSVLSPGQAGPRIGRFLQRHMSWGEEQPAGQAGRDSLGGNSNISSGDTNSNGNSNSHPVSIYNSPFKASSVPPEFPPVSGSLLGTTEGHGNLEMKESPVRQEPMTSPGMGSTFEDLQLPVPSNATVGMSGASAGAQGEQHVTKPNPAATALPKLKEEDMYKALAILGTS